MDLREENSKFLKSLGLVFVSEAADDEGMWRDVQIKTIQGDFVCGTNIIYRDEQDWLHSKLEFIKELAAIKYWVKITKYDATFSVPCP
jgi:hypothetical protein